MDFSETLETVGKKGVREVKKMMRVVVIVLGSSVKLGAYFLGFLCLMLMAACFLMAALAFPGEWITILCLAAMVSSVIFADKPLNRMNHLILGKNGAQG